MEKHSMTTGAITNNETEGKKEATREMAALADELTVASEQLVASIDEMVAKIHAYAQKAERNATAAAEMDQQLMATPNGEGTVRVAGQGGFPALVVSDTTTEGLTGETSHSHALVDLFKRLSATAAEMSKADKGLQDMLQHANILAINATIEAARAGDAGKGLVVIANEFKQLVRKGSDSFTEMRAGIAIFHSDAQEAQACVENLQKGLDEDGLSSDTTAVTHNIGKIHGHLVALVKEMESIAESAEDASKRGEQAQAAAWTLQTLCYRMAGFIRVTVGRSL